MPIRCCGIVRQETVEFWLTSFIVGQEEVIVASSRKYWSTNALLYSGGIASIASSNWKPTRGDSDGGGSGGGRLSTARVTLVGALGASLSSITGESRVGPEVIGMWALRRSVVAAVGIWFPPTH